VTGPDYYVTEQGIAKAFAHRTAEDAHERACTRPVRAYARGSQHADPARGSFKVKPRNRRRRAR
jgi:hypothetical protein